MSGTTRVGSRLSASAGSWSGTGLTFSYAWQRCDAAGTNCATTNVAGSSYSLTNADAGATLRVVVKAQNAAGTASATSAATAVVAAKKGGKTVRAQSLPARPRKLHVLLRLSYRLGRR